MSDYDAVRERIREEQDRSWESGYSHGQFGLDSEPDSKVSWPSHWRIGYEAAK